MKEGGSWPFLRLFSYEKKALVIQRERGKKVLLAQFLSLIILIVRSTNIFSLETPEADDDNRKVLLPPHHYLLFSRLP